MTPGSEFLDTTDFQGISIGKIQPFMASQMTTKHEEKKTHFELWGDDCDDLQKICFW